MRIIFDPFNSEIFGVKMGNIDGSQPWEAGCSVAAALERARQERYRHLSVKVDTGDKAANSENDPRVTQFREEGTLHV